MEIPHHLKHSKKAYFIDRHKENKYLTPLEKPGLVAIFDLLQ
jgi:hypothetical protein